MMMRSNTIFAARLAAVFTVIAWIVAATAPALAADPVFPTGSRLGLVPPTGMTVSHTFMGFEDRFRNAAILLATFPTEAYPQLDNSMVPEKLKQQNLNIEKREPISLADGHGFLLSGTQTINNAPYRKFMLVASTGNLTALVTVQVPEQDPSYTDQIIHDALATLTVRVVPEAETLSLLPFTIGDMAGFRIDDILPSRAVMLVDGPPASAQAKTAPATGAKPTEKSVPMDKPSGNADRTGRPVNARLLIAAVTGGPADLKDAADFARRTFDQIGGIKKARIQDAEPLRIDGQPGFELLANAQDPETDEELRVVQWLRFGSGGYLQMVGIARADVWIDEFTRMRKVRDAVTLR